MSRGFGLRTARLLLASMLVVSGAVFASGPVWADVDNTTGTNVQEGDNRGTTSQSGTGRSGDAVGGQVAGVVSSGRTSVDATNASRDSDVSSGDVEGSNAARSFVGQNFEPGEGARNGRGILSDITDSSAANLQEGDNRYSLAQTVNASSGDGVAGSVIGVVTAAGGSTSVVAANTTTDSDISTGDADGTNDATAFVGQNFAGCEAEGIAVCEAIIGTGDITGSAAANLQEGDNRFTARQAANSSTGDGVGGQVVGAVSAGATSIDATNRSDGVSIDTGDSTSANTLDAFTGQNVVGCRATARGLALAACEVIDVEISLRTSDIDSAAGTNVQEGDNRATASQSANATTGDGVGGQVIGAVTSAGGSASIVAANTSRDSDVSTGDADATNDSTLFTGQNVEGCRAEASGLLSVAACESALDLSFDLGGLLASDVTNATGTNVQEGDNRLTHRQTANASTGDGVAGQVIGSVSAGATSIDATNLSDGVSVDTGDATSANDSDLFVGQNVQGCSATAGGVLALAACESSVEIDIGIDLGGGGVFAQDVTSSTAVNVQEGDNRATLSQAANASSGDGVAGEVIGAVTSAGGSASIVAANTSRDSDVSTGDADASNASDVQVGQNVEGCRAEALGLLVAASCESEIDVDINVGTDLRADVSDITDSDATNLQEGDNRLSGGQTANANTGDGVAGQVIGAVSAGATSVDATNRSEDVSVETGDAESANAVDAFVGQNVAGCTASASGQLDFDQCPSGALTGDVTSSDGVNVQEGDNRKTFGQTADASSGDAVAGQVSGVVTSAGGSASVVVANTSSGIDASTGESEFTNDDTEFVGQNVTEVPISTGPPVPPIG